MASLAQPPVTRERFDTLVAELYGDRSSPAFQPTARPSVQQAIVQAAEQVAAPPAAPVDPARLTKAMDLVLANAVSLLPDGTARVKSGSHTYHLAPNCTCEDAQRRGNDCKHKLAVDLHRRATALLEGTAPQAAPPAAPPAAAPASACFKFRLSASMELMYTLRGTSDAELQTRIKDTLPLLQEILEGCEERATRRVTEREAAHAAQAQQAQPAPSAPDLQAVLQQAVQQALAAQGQANGSAPAPANGQASHPAPATPKDFCAIHQVPMYLNSNERGSWYSHLATDDAGQEYFCKGRSRRNGR